MSKSRSERGGKSGTPVTAQNAAPQSMSNAIIPGKFMDSDWNQLLEDESSEDFIFDIVEEVVGNACNIIYDKIIEQRVQPYTVSAARKMILDIIQWQFLHCDGGETADTTPSWEEDEEAVPHMADSWSQGAVPHLFASEDVPEEDTIVTELDAVSTDNPDGVSESDMFTDTVDQSVDLMLEGVSQLSVSPGATVDLAAEDSSSVILPQPPSKEAKSRHRKFSKHFGKLAEFRDISETPTTDERPRHRAHAPHSKKPRITDSSQNILQMQQIDASDIVFDEKGYPVKVEKINFAKLPNHRIATGFTIQDREMEPSWNTRKVKVSPRIEESTDQIKNLYSTNLPTDTVEMRGVTAHDLHRTLNNRLPPPLVDSIEVVSAGVVVREAGIVKRGARQGKQDQGDPSTLRPLAGTNSPARILKAKDIITDNSPIIRPFQSSRVLPNIRSKCN